MFDCAGWLIVDFDKDEAESTRYQTVTLRIQALLDRVREFFPSAHVDWINGRCFVLLATSRNHGRETLLAIPEIIADILASLPGSFGVLQYRDDEIDDDPRALRTIEIGALTVVPTE